MNVLILYAQPVFWSMGEGCGAASFTLFPSRLAARGHQVRICLPEATGADGGNLGSPARNHRVEDLSDEPEVYHGCFLHRFHSSRGFVPDADRPLPARLADRLDCWLRFQREARRAAARIVRRHPPDLVVGMGYYEAPAAYHLARRINVPNVTRLFGSTLALHFRSPLRFYANFPEVVALRTPAQLILISDDGAAGDDVARRLRVPPERIVHLRNGVDFERFRPGPASGPLRERLGLGPRQAVLLTGTRLAAEKKLERAIDVLASVTQEGLDAVLILTGDGPEKNKLEAYARSARVAGRVRFPGPIPQRDMADWYRLSDVVLSLLDRTNASNPVFEAMACGRPVVALDVGTTASVVRPGETGLLIPREDLPRIGKQVAALLRDVETRRRQGEAAARRIRALLPDLGTRWEHEVDLLEAAAQRRLPLRHAADEKLVSWSTGETAP